MKYDANTPIWLQVMTSLETDIVTGLRLPGSKLPGARDLALSYEINPNTAARVYQELEKTGLCETRRGLGTFVTMDEDRIRTARTDLAEKALNQFLAKMETLGFSREDAIAMLAEKPPTSGQQLNRSDS
mgnify:CR=1 FL=1